MDLRQAGQRSRRTSRRKSIRGCGRSTLPSAEGILRGLGHLTAEDEQLGGRFVTLRGRRQINFGSCSYLGLETDLRLKNAACDAVARYGVQFASSRAYVSCPPYAELERLLAAMFETAAGRGANDHAGALRRVAAPDRERRRGRLRSARSQQRAGGVADAAGRGDLLPLRPPQPDRSARTRSSARSASVTAGSGIWPTASTACTAIRLRSRRCRI